MAETVGRGYEPPHQSDMREIAKDKVLFVSPQDEINEVNSGRQNIRPSEEGLNRYVEQTNEIRRLSSPHISELDGADSYRVQLLENFARIGKIALDNGDVLSKYFFPVISSRDKLEKHTVEQMRKFSQSLFNAYQLNSLDSPIVYQQALRLLEEADDISDDEVRIYALDEVVSAAYVMVNMTLRLLPVNTVCYDYANVGFQAAQHLLAYLDKERFVQLPDEAKELVLINSRYIRVVAEIGGAPGNPELNAQTFKLMMDALALYDDPFYREQAPRYNWSVHLFRTLEYIASLTELNNEKGFDTEQIKTIYECTVRLKDLYESDLDFYRQLHATNFVYLYYHRNAYLAGDISLDEYKEYLVSLIMSDMPDDASGNVPLVMLHAPLEYILLLNPDKLSAAEQSYLRHYYSRLVSYMHRTTKKDRLSFLLTYLALILQNFIELPGGPSFKTIGLSIAAALHPPTYVHTLAVADFSKYLTHKLLLKNPELFVGLFDYDTPERVLTHMAEIEEYAYQASLCHDFGKLLIAEIILTYGRNLLDDEFSLIQSHPSTGAYLLKKFPSTAPYADVAHGHHKWYNNQGGYPDDFDMEASPYKTLVSIVAVADCLDAATDAVGRSYKKGLSFDSFVEELRAGSGTRYAPYVVELFDDPKICKELETLLAKDRDENYREAYFLLKSYETN